MRIVGHIVLGLLLYSVFLAIRFPYDTLVKKSVRTLERATKASVTYTPVSAGPFGVRVKDVRIVMSSGLNLQMAEARIAPTRDGIRANLKQEEGSAELLFDGRQVKLALEDLEVDTASSQFGVSRFRGTITLDLTNRTGSGELHLSMPNFRPPPPLPEASVELGGPFEIQNVGTPELPRSLVLIDLKMIGGEGRYSASGNVNIETPPAGGSPLLNGSLPFESPRGRGTLRLGGTWENPSWAVIPR